VAVASRRPEASGMRREAGAVTGAAARH